MSDEEKSNSESQLALPYNETNGAIQDKISAGSFKLLPVNGRSKVWNIFYKIEDNEGFIIPDKVCCAHCFGVLTFSKRTSSHNLVRHKCFKKSTYSDIRKTVPTKALKTEKSKLSSPNADSSNICKEALEDSLEQNRNQIRHNILNGTYKLRTKFSRCKVWHVFKFIEDSEGNRIPKKVCCKMCFQVLNFHEHTTSNLVKHKCYLMAKDSICLKNSPNKTNDLMETKSSNDSESLTEKNNKSLEATSYTDLDEFPPTKEWEESYMIEEMEEEPPSKKDVNSNLKKEVEKIFSEWCIENFRPFKLAKDGGLRRFAEFMIWIGANYGTSMDIGNLLPEVTNITNCISSQYEEAFKSIKNEVTEGCQNGYGLTSKIWTDNTWHQSYISLTMHYIKNGQLITKLLGLIAVCNEENIINNIIEVKLLQTLSNYNCVCNDSIIVTDGSFYMSNFTHISCINYILDNAINQAIAEVEELTELNNECLKIKEFFTESNIKYNLTTIFNSLCTTKWNAFYYLLNAIKTNWLEIENIFVENNKLLEYEDINEHYIEQVLNVLKPFEDVLKKLECKEHPTIHLVYACINGLKGSCSAEDNDDDTIQKFKEILSKQLQTTVFSNLSITHKIALFLFPPANKLIQFSEYEKNLIKNQVSVLLKPYAQNLCKPIKKTSTTTSKSNAMLTSYLKNFVTPPTNNSSSDLILNEIYTYESLNIPFEDDFDILQWWHTRQSQFPLLYILSCKILATPATCTASDLVLSMLKQMAESNPNILSNPETTNQLIFLNFNSDKSSPFEELYSEDIRIENDVIEEI